MTAVQTDSTETTAPETKADMGAYQNAWYRQAEGRPLGPPIPDLSPEQEIAVLARILFREGYDDMLAGHISYKQPDGTFLVTPYGLTWDEVAASDIMRVDFEAETVLDGKWTVTPAIALHARAHAARDDVVWAVHNHPKWATVWAAVHRLPGAFEQTSALIGPDVVLYDEYLGGAATQLDSEAAIAALGDAAAAILANHGVFVVARGLPQVYMRCVSLETRARVAWAALAVGEPVPLSDQVVSFAGLTMDRAGWPGAFEAMVRRELRRDPSFLD